ncbi:MAG: RecX family transcriptional regulator [Oligoflexia bacterium]|nr:RecX family transcriptional regulator [Oligoflexia bacterium]
MGNNAVEKPKARELALRRLSLREHSAAELRTYLRRKGFAEGEADEAISELVTKGLIDDRRFARAFARAQVMRGKGPRQILAGLRAKGVRIELAEVSRIYSEVSEVDELQAARQLLERRYPKAAQDFKERRRAFQALLRRGFSAEVARQCLRFSGASGDPESD